MSGRYAYRYFCLFLLPFFLLAGCGQNTSGDSSQPTAAASTSSKSTKPKSDNDKKESDKASKKGSRDNSPQVLTPEASGEKVLGTDTAAIDVSHAEDGYVMVQYTGTNHKVKFLVTTPGGIAYSYLLHPEKGYEVFPFSEGNGTYQLQVYENIDGDRYSTLYSETLEVTLEDEFGPFLYPNQYVWFTKESEAVAKASELVASADTDLDALTAIYHYVIDTISYDEEKAASVEANYLPDIDETLKVKKGICFDYASLITAMLRSQKIPTRLEIGYSGEVYHAWISAYLSDKGWVDDIIQFDGKSWCLMDPTLAAGNSAKDIGDYIGDGSNYIVKYMR